MSLPIISIAQMREWEAVTWSSGLSQEAVMRRAGAAVAGHALALTRSGDHILVLAGRGHNGGDARLAAERLIDRKVTVIEAREPGAALTQLEAALRPAEDSCALIVDGLFGIGLDRPLGGAWQSLVEAMNASGVPIVSVDVPSGLEADSGEPQGTAVRAAVTVTFGAPKQGLIRAIATPYVGRLVVADIGLTPCPFHSDVTWSVASDFAQFPPRRQVESHKGTYGHLAVFAGSVGYHGAAVLATRAAQRAHPGLVTVYTDPDIYVPVASQLQSAMVQTWDSDMLLPANTSAVLAGPGLASPTLTAKEHKAVLRMWHELAEPMVVDASALGWLVGDPHTPDGALRVIAPHPGEAARLFKTSVANIQANRLGAIRELSRRVGNCWVVLKGHQTMIGRSSGEVRINPTGNPHMAQGGSGDVLAGFIAGLIAQPALQSDPLRTLSYAAWEHGAAADRLQAENSRWTIEELTAVLGKGW